MMLMGAVHVLYVLFTKGFFGFVLIQFVTVFVCAFLPLVLLLLLLSEWKKKLEVVTHCVIDFVSTFLHPPPSSSFLHTFPFFFLSIFFLFSLSLFLVHPFETYPSALFLLLHVSSHIHTSILFFFLMKQFIYLHCICYVPMHI